MQPRLPPASLAHAAASERALLFAPARSLERADVANHVTAKAAKLARLAGRELAAKARRECSDVPYRLTNSAPKLPRLAGRKLALGRALLLPLPLLYLRRKSADGGLLKIPKNAEHCTFLGAERILHLQKLHFLFPGVWGRTNN